MKTVLIFLIILTTLCGAIFCFTLYACIRLSGLTAQQKEYQDLAEEYMASLKENNEVNDDRLECNTEVNELLSK